MAKALGASSFPTQWAQDAAESAYAKQRRAARDAKASKRAKVKPVPLSKNGTLKRANAARAKAAGAAIRTNTSAALTNRKGGKLTGARARTAAVLAAGNKRAVSGTAVKPTATKAKTVKPLTTKKAVSVGRQGRPSATTAGARPVRKTRTATKAGAGVTRRTRAAKGVRNLPGQKTRQVGAGIKRATARVAKGGKFSASNG